jgi:hypothetical protein
MLLCIGGGTRARCCPPATVLVAMSGGQDSVCLLGLLVDLRPQWSWQLRAVHCDHRWRADSAANGVFVAELCDRWRVPCAVVVAEGNDRDGRTEAARQWRHTPLSRWQRPRAALAQSAGTPPAIASLPRDLAPMSMKRKRVFSLKTSLTRRLKSCRSAAVRSRNGRNLAMYQRTSC